MPNGSLKTRNITRPTNTISVLKKKNTFFYKIFIFLRVCVFPKNMYLTHNHPSTQKAQAWLMCNLILLKISLTITENYSSIDSISTDSTIQALKIFRGNEYVLNFLFQFLKNCMLLGSTEYLIKHLIDIPTYTIHPSILYVYKTSSCRFSFAQVLYQFLSSLL